MYALCLFLNPHLTTYYANIGVQIIDVLELDIIRKTYRWSAP